MYKAGVGRIQCGIVQLVEQRQLASLSQGRARTAWGGLLGHSLWWNTVREPRGSQRVSKVRIARTIESNEAAMTLTADLAV